MALNPASMLTRLSKLFIYNLPLILIVILAAALRIWGVRFGLPYLYHPDEPVSVEKALTIFRTGDPNPHFFDWPSLLFYLNALAYLPYYLIGHLQGHFMSPYDLRDPVMIEMGAGYTSQPGIFLLGRLMSIAFGCGAVMLTYLAGRDLTGRRAVGVVAAVLLAVSPTAVINSRFVAPDMLLLFFVMLSLWSSIKVSREGKLWHYLVAGAAAGLAASSKYNGVLVFVCLLCAHTMAPDYKRLLDRRLALGAAACIAAFFLTTPYALLDWTSFTEGLSRDAQHYSRGHAGMEGNSLVWYITYLWTIEGPACLLALLEIIRGIRYQSRQTGLLAAFPVIYFVIISRAVVRNERTLLPVLPFVCVLAAVLLVTGVGWATRQWGWMRFGMAVTALLMILLAAGPALETVRATEKLTRVDSRETARRWIEHHLPEGSQIAVEAYSPFINPTHFRIVPISKAYEHPASWYRQHGIHYVVCSEGMFGRFYKEPSRYATVIQQYEALFQSLQQVRIFRDGGYEVRVYQVPNQ